MPSTSGRAATYPKRSDKLKFFHELKDLRDKRRLEKGLAPAVKEYSEDSANPSAEQTTSEENRN